MMAIPPVSLDTGFPDFPDTFQDFFSKLSDENDEGVVSLLEDKLIPRAKSNNNNNNKRQQHEKRWVLSRRSFHRRPVEYHDTSPSPAGSRRRSSSIAVARQTPDLHRFLQAEQQRPWGHLSPAPVATPSPSPVGSRPVSPRPRQNYRSRTASMPVVPRHKVSD